MNIYENDDSKQQTVTAVNKNWYFYKILILDFGSVFSMFVKFLFAINWHSHFLIVKIIYKINCFKNNVS